MVFSYLLEFWFEFIGRVLGEHVHGWCFLLEEIGDELRSEGEGRGESVGIHVGEDCMTHLACHDALVEAVGDVHRRHEEFSFQHFRLDEHAEFATHMPCVDGLDRWLIGGRQLGEVHHLCLVEQFPPVEVRPVVGWEFLEERMLCINISTGGVRWTHLEP